MTEPSINETPEDQELNLKLRELASDLSVIIRARNKTATQTVVTAYQIQEGDEVTAVRKRLGWSKVMAGDYIVDFGGDMYFFIRQDLFYEKWVVIAGGSSDE